MIPLLAHPSLILSEPFRPTGRPDLDSLLAPGEAVRATVLNVQDDGALLLLVKGVTLRATSLIGRLSVGQVVDAHVESRDGQLLLRLDQQPRTESANRVGALAADRARTSLQGGPGEAQRMAAILKTLLPADAPLASGLARLAASLAAAVERGELAQQTLARFQALAQQILLAPEQSVTPLTGDHIRRALLALGVQHEPALLAEWIRTGAITGRDGAPNLKVLLMALLAEADADGLATQAPSVHAEPSARSAGSSALSTAPASPLYDGTLARSGPDVPSSGATGLHGRAWPEPTPLDLDLDRLDQPRDRQVPIRPAGAGTSPAPSKAELLSQAEKPAVADEPSPGQPALPQPGERAVAPSLPQALRGDPMDVGAPPASVVGPGPQSSSPDEGIRQRGDHQPPPGKTGPVVRAAGLSSSVPPGLAVTEEESLEPPGASSLPAQRGLPESEGPGRGGWIRDAQQVLTMIERTQTLAVLNGQAGQPILFELPLAGGRQVWLAVEERLAGEGRSQDQPRSYSVVTLLTLDGLGAVRVDTLLTGKRLSARFLLDQPEVRQRVTGYLPALNASLSAKGYHIDLLTIDLGEPQVVRGDDVRARAVPRVSLVNRKV